MDFQTREQLNYALIRMNTLRAGEFGNHVPEGVEEGFTEAIDSASGQLVVYGTLAPGGPNHRVLADLQGDWHEGWVTGELLTRGWGAAMSYPAISWNPDGERIKAHLLASPDLRGSWPRLDRFEGLEYKRILAPFCTDEGHVMVGNLYVMESPFLR